MFLKIWPKAGCEADEFECEDGACIKLERRCDGRNDCLNGDDEDYCANGGNGTEFNNEVYTVSPDESATTTDYCKWFTC